MSVLSYTDQFNETHARGNGAFYYSITLAPETGGECSEHLSLVRSTHLLLAFQTPSKTCLPPRRTPPAPGCFCSEGNRTQSLCGHTIITITKKKYISLEIFVFNSWKYLTQSITHLVPRAFCEVRYTAFYNNKSVRSQPCGWHLGSNLTCDPGTGTASPPPWRRDCGCDQVSSQWSGVEESGLGE